ncbi:MAG TPA: pitrilysin family protein [Bacteroidia bacterium]|nr:pitrilysin family protein [Bacteroidia bacterium]
MKSFKKLFAAFICLFIFSTSGSYSQNKQLPAPEKVTAVEGITEYKLANGLRVLIFPDPSKSTITVNITYLVGSRVEGYGETGMAHLLEHMVFKGSTKHPNIPQELTAHGARPNGTTWYDRTNYFETFSATEENLKWALDLESDRMVNSFIAKKDLETEFSVVRNEFESGENNPSGVLEERVMSTAFLWHNYGKSTIGSKEDIERVPIENLQAFYKKYYQPDYAVLTVAGKIDEAKTIALVNEYFGVIPKPTRILPQEYTTEPVQDGERIVELKRVGDVQVVTCGYHITNGSHPDYAATELLVEVLTNEPSGRLYKALVETKKASSTYGYSFALKDPGYAIFTAEVLKEKSLDTARKTMTDVFDNLKTTPVTKEEMDRAKNKLLKNFDLLYNNSDRIGLELSEYISQGDWRLWFIYRDNLENTTLEDVNRVAKAYFKPSNRTTGVFIPDASPDRAQIPAPPDVQKLLKEYKGKKKLADAEAFDPSPANIDSRTISSAIGGGAEYSLVKKTTRGGSVNFTLTLRIGNQAVMVNKGTVAQLTASMLRRGTKNKTYQQINDEFDRLKANVSIFGNGQTVYVSVQTIKENFLSVVSLLTEVLRTPAFSQQEFEKLREEELANIEQQKSEPQSIASNLFERALNPYPKDDFRYPMTFDEQVAAIKALKVEDLKSFYDRYYTSTHASVAVVGDFDEQPLLIAINSMLNKWVAPVLYDRAKDIYFDVPSANTKVNAPDKANAMLLCGFNMELRDDDPDYPALVMGNYMLGGGFLNSRLATRIRQKEGISYGVGSFMQADPIDKSGSFGSYAIYNPDNSDKLIAAYKDEIEKMLKEGFTAAELKDASTGYLQGQNVTRAQDRSLANKLSSNLFLNRTMKWDAELESKIAALTVDQVNTAIRKWIKPEKITYVQAGDFERKSGGKAEVPASKQN